MSFDYELQEAKRRELESHFAGFLVSKGLGQKDSEGIAAELLGLFVRISPPKKESEFLELIVATSYSGAGGGRSAKAGNVFLNLGQLLGGIASGVVVFSSLSDPVDYWVPIAAAVSLWANLRGVTHVNVTENDVGVLLALWKLRDGHGIVRQSESEILSATNDHLEKNGRGSIGLADARAALTHLSEIRSIRQTKEGGWLLLERIAVPYR